MTDLSLYVLDITNNSVRAGAKNISISLEEIENVLTMRITDDGCGMSAEQVARLSDPFFTTRTTRSVGLGIPFLRMLAEQTGGSVRIQSKSEMEYEDHGTVIEAVFHTDHIDFIPYGDLVETVVTLVQGNPEIDFVYRHVFDSVEVSMNTSEMREVLGADIPLNSFEVLAFIRNYLGDQYGKNKI